MEIPATMKRLVLTTPDEDMSKVVLSVEEVPVPKPRSGELLIKVAAAPINPSDYGVWRNTKPERCPLAIGNEGSGVVVASGGGSARIVAGVGTKVGFVNLPKGQGAYSEYGTVSAMTGTFPLPADLEVELAASFFVNPYTVFGILDTVQQRGATGLVHTAAASQVRVRARARATRLGLGMGLEARTHGRGRAGGPDAGQARQAAGRDTAQRRAPRRASGDPPVRVRVGLWA